MQIVARHPEDLDELDRLIHGTRDAEQRDRYRAVRLAIEGESTRTIQAMLHRSRGFVQRWAYAYRDGGLCAIEPGKPPGAAAKLTPAQEQAFKSRMLAGPVEADGERCTLRGKDAVRILQCEFGVTYSLPGVYDLLHRLNLACLKPRPKHRKNDEPAMRQWLAEAPLLSSACGSNKTRPPRLSSGSRTRPASGSKAR